MTAKRQPAVQGEIKPPVMQDRGAWQFTDDLIARLKKWDSAAMTEFYNANYRIFLGMAKKFVWKQRHLCNNYIYELDDIMQQVYVDLPYYDFSSRCNLYYCIVKGSFLRVNVGGITTSQNKTVKQSLIFSYDAPVNGTEDNASPSYLLDRFASSPKSREWYQSDEYKAKKKAYRDRPEVQAHIKEYNAQNRERINAQKLANYHKNKERMNTRRRELYAINRERILARRRELYAQTRSILLDCRGKQPPDYE